MSYGAFVKLEDGIEGLVHISEMSWTKRISHPSELVQIDDEIEVVVLGINKEKQEISLGMKQTQENPWDQVAERYPTGAMVKGTVRNLTNYGAFIEIEEGIDGLLHVSDMSWTRKISHPNEVVEKGQEIECKVLSVDQDRRRIALGLKQLDEDPWATDIPDATSRASSSTARSRRSPTSACSSGWKTAWKGLLHISELADHKVENPEEVVKVGDEIEVKILRVDPDERKIGLSRKRVEWAEEDEAEAEDGGESTAADRQGTQGWHRRRPRVRCSKPRATNPTSRPMTARPKQPIQKPWQTNRPRRRLRKRPRSWQPTKRKKAEANEETEETGKRRITNPHALRRNECIANQRWPES